MNRFLALVFLGGLFAGGMLVANPAKAEPLGDVITAIRDSGGHYVRAGASLKGADCSGLVSVAQSLATGQPIRRLGSTRTILAGGWPHAIRGASREDRFVIGANSRHMVASINGVNIEATTSGQPFKVGAAAASPFESRFQQWHVDPTVLI
jgi:hypothetical protein